MGGEDKRREKHRLPDQFSYKYRPNMMTAMRALPGYLYQRAYLGDWGELDD